MPKQYRVLWLDDQHAELQAFNIQAENAGIMLDGFTSAEEGFNVLTENITLYDAILLDGLFFKNKNQAVGTEDEQGLGLAIKRIMSLQSRKILPWFVLSGQQSFIKGNSILSAFDKQCFDKTNPKDIIELFSQIKEEANRHVDIQIRHDNAQIFSIFEAGFLDARVNSQVLDLLKTQSPTSNVQLKAILTNIRSIQESCFLQLQRIRVVPGHLSFNGKIKHLSGNKSPVNYLPTTPQYQNEAIEYLNKFIYETCSKYIHNLDDAAYNGYMISPYAVDSLRSGLLELLLWFKKTYEENK